MQITFAKSFNLLNNAAWHSSDPPLSSFLRGVGGQGVGVNFKHLSQRGGVISQRQVYLKGGGGRGGGGGAGTFPIEFFQGLSFLHSKITLPFAKLCYGFEQKLFFSATIIL